ncbi:MAG: dTDP-4-dehydrorhamnose reductase [Nitrospinae bacterium]|nr:dTDP-4-dehydrorhamnose reductase [Nitrospinota bacterium]
MRILLTGAAGQLGQALAPALAALGAVNALDRSRLDLADADALRRTVRATAPDLIVNAAAWTAVDKAETAPEAARRVNARAPGIMAEEAARRGALFVHYSTDYVFDGAADRPYDEEDPTAPLNVYGASKLEGERAVMAAGGRSLIFRTSWVWAPWGMNFYRTILRLAGERRELTVVDDQIGAPTFAPAIADGTVAVVRRIVAEGEGAPAPWGIYHMTCAGQTSWAGFAAAIVEHASLPCRIVPIPTSAYPTPARRPLRSLLANEKLAARFGVALPFWRTPLDTLPLDSGGG